MEPGRMVMNGGLVTGRARLDTLAEEERHHGHNRMADNSRWSQG